MTRKKILIINPIALYPKIMASQDRVINMIMRLSQDHDVDLITVVRNQNSVDQTLQSLGNHIRKFYPINAVNPENNRIKRTIEGIGFLLSKYLRHLTSDYYYAVRHIGRMRQIIKNQNYDIIQVEYWLLGELLNDGTSAGTLKVIDTHDVLFEKREMAFRESDGQLTNFQKKILARYKLHELQNYSNADLLISITNSDRNTLSKIFPSIQHRVISSGQDIEYFGGWSSEPDENTILLYGSMGGTENINAFFRFYKRILPVIEDKIPNVRTLVVGANPTEDIRQLSNGNITVTGYVDDPRPYIGRSTIMMLPLSVAGGFRSRTVEVMAMGVPVVGTHAAFDNFEMESGVHGYISDDDNELAGFAIRMMTDKDQRKSMSEACKELAKNCYSVEGTYGKLSEYYASL